MGGGGADSLTLCNTSLLGILISSQALIDFLGLNVNDYVHEILVLLDTHICRQYPKKCIENISLKVIKWYYLINTERIQRA